ncbi:NACHT domain-containing protein [Nannocystis pusilla]|uniref:NACHT domain-containing protein n=1 Tax=Nannocystis pusilla TaxID=889268 RepID=UPI003BEFEDAE
MAAEAKLAEFLVKSFTDDELRTHLAGEPGAFDVLPSLPGTAASLRSLAQEAVRALERRGLIDHGFFDRLMAARPRRCEAIAELRRVCLGDAPAESPAAERTASGDDGFARYRMALAGAHRVVRLLAVGGAGPASTLPIEALYVPLRLRGGRYCYSIGALLRALIRADGEVREGAPRIVVLGDPGSGKTTLCRYLTAALAGAIEGLLPPGSAAPLPLLLPLRDYVAKIAKADVSLPEFLREQARVRLSVSFSERELEAWLRSGRAVVLLDGLDEVGDPTPRATSGERVDATWRATICERIDAFAAVYPEAALLVTSRVAGYEESALPSSGPQRFSCYRIEPFRAEELAAFVRRWYQLQVTDEPSRRQRLTEGLLAALQATPAVGKLATNPLLATLVARVYAADERLPGERAQLYERCVQTLLETWPELRGRGPTNLEIDVQRRCLEDVAWHMLDGASERSAGAALIAEPELLAVVAARLGEEPEFARLGPRGRERAAKQWIERFECENGMLVEDSPGVFGFIHRSLGEYMAACRLERVLSAEAEVGWIVEHARKATWREVALLRLGRRGGRDVQIDPVYAALMGDPGGREFLLMCLREGMGLTPEQLGPLIAAGIAGRAGQNLEILADVFRFSPTETPAIEAWFVKALRSAPLEGLVELLPAAARVGVSPEVVEGALGRRDDATRARAVALFLLPPVRESSESAPLVALSLHLRSRAEVGAALLAFTGALPDAPTFAAAVAVACGPASPGCRAALTLGLVLGAVWSLGCIKPPMRALRIEWLDWRAIVPATVPSWPEVESTRMAVKMVEGSQRLVREAYPLAAPHEPLLGYTGGDFACYADAPPWQFLGYFPPSAGVDVEAYVRSCDPGYWEAWYGPNPRDEVREHLDPVIADEEDDEWELGNYTPEKCVVVDLHEALGELQVVAADAPADGLCADDLLAMHRSGELDAGDLLIRVIALHAAQVRIAADTFPAEPALAEQYGAQRQAHTWIWLNWETIEASLPEPPEADRLALFLALGWTQYTTTGRWPTSERWRRIAGGPAPEHWWPRVHWLLCRQLAADDGASRWPDVRAALVEGEADAELAGVAARLRAWLPEA